MKDFTTRDAIKIHNSDTVAGNTHEGGGRSWLELMLQRLGSDARDMLAQQANGATQQPAFGKVAGMRGVQMGPGATPFTRMPGTGEGGGWKEVYPLVLEGCHASKGLRSWSSS